MQAVAPGHSGAVASTTRATRDYVARGTRFDVELGLAGAAARPTYNGCMCRNIRTLFNFDPPATEDEIRAASTQFVRKLSGFTRPSQANEAAFERAIDDVAAAARTLLDSLVTNAAPRDRDEWAARARARAAERYARP
jgi:hypothetical protein